MECTIHHTATKHPTTKSYVVILVLSTPKQTHMNWTLWRIAIAVTAVYGVGVKPLARSYEAPYSKKLRGNPYVEYPIANTYMYELEPKADGHSYQSSVWSEPYTTQLRSTKQQNAMGLSLCRVPHCKHL